MAVIHQQLLPSPTTPRRARIFVDCLKMLKILRGISPSHPGSGGLLFAQEKDFKMSMVLPAGFENWFFFKGKISFWKPQMWRDSLAPAEQTIGCLIITPRIHFATPRMSWIGVDLLKLGFFEGICLPGALFATTPEGSSGGVCVCVHGMGHRIRALWKKQMWCTPGCLEV